jgi:hypothetical protein
MFFDRLPVVAVAGIHQQATRRQRRQQQHDGEKEQARAHGREPRTRSLPPFALGNHKGLAHALTFPALNFVNRQALDGTVCGLSHSTDKDMM